MTWKGGSKRGRYSTVLCSAVKQLSTELRISSFYLFPVAQESFFIAFRGGFHHIDICDRATCTYTLYQYTNHYLATLYHLTRTL